MNEKELKIKIKENMNWWIDTVKKWASIKSISHEDDSKYPFSKEVQESLEFIIKRFDEIGVKTYIDPEGYYGYAEVGSGEQLIGILGHVDVVPVGDASEWKIDDPFKPEIIDNVLYGRGVGDDKGPIISIFSAFKLLLQDGFAFNKRIRFIFGGDEEVLWRGIYKYVEKEEIPNLSFVADAEFPVVYAEKGLLNHWIKSENDLDIELEAGTAFNAVADVAKYKGIKQSELIAELTKLRYKFKEDNGYVIVKGTAAHASTPEKGVNAAALLCKALYNIGVHSPLIDFITNKIGSDPHARNIFKGLKDEPTGEVTLNMGKVTIKDGKEALGIDIRFPVVDTTKEDIMNYLVEATDGKLTVEEYDYVRSNYMPKDNKWVKLLQSAYQEVTGDMTPAKAQGGATYARALDNSVSFGAAFPQCGNNEHAPNEKADLEYVEKAILIYTKALIKINEM